MKKFISLMLVLAMLVTVLAVGIASTSAAETATVTIYGLDGSTEVKEFSVGDEFTVYTTLDISASVSSGLVGSIQGTQTYTSSVLALSDSVTSTYGEFADLDKVFPVTGAATMSNGATAGTIYYNASAVNASSAFKFASSDAQLIVTTYKVTAAGTAEVRNALENLGAADDDITRIIFNGELQSGMSISGGAYFTEPTTTLDHAEVTIRNLDGTAETKSFNIGDSFTVYTTLNVSACVTDGKVASVNGVQKYTSSVLRLSDGSFPVMGSGTIINASNLGSVKYAASSVDGFTFADDSALLIQTTYVVKANGYANVSNNLIVLAAADDDLTKIVFAGETQSGMSYSMSGSFTAPGDTPDPTTAPTTAPTSEPTTTPTTAPTEAPTQADEKLTVAIKGLTGTSEVKEFSVGDTFTVYTMLDASASVSGGVIASIDGSQTYTADKLTLTDATTGTYSEVVNKAAMFPILGTSVVASASNGTILFNASVGSSIGSGFTFYSDTSKLIVTNYKVTAAGTATIETSLKTLIAADADLTKIVYKSALQDGMSIDLHSQYTDPGATPTEAPTEAPTQAPTQAPTEAPTQAPTQPTTTTTVTITGFDGSTETKTFNVGDTFTVYTTLNIADIVSNGMVAAINATQTYSTDTLATADSIDSTGIVTDTASMFPVIGSSAVAKIHTDDGVLKYNASTPGIGAGFAFNTDDSLAVVTKYTVTAAGTAEITNKILTLAAADSALTRIVTGGVVADGYVLKGYASFTEPGSGTRFLLGDADDNGDIETIDATWIQRNAAYIPTPYDDTTIMQGDVDGDGSVDITDASLIQRWLASQPVAYPIGEYVTR